MKKILNYISFVPFAVFLGSLVVYLVYILQIKINNSIIVTEELTNRLKTYLIIALVSLFIGLLIILIKKIYTLFMTSSKIEKEDKKKIKEKKSKKIKIQPERDDNVLKVKLIDPKMNGDIIVGKLEDTMQDVEVYINDKKEYNFKLDGISCPECGGLISKDAAICPHCGILFSDELLNLLTKEKKGEKEVKHKKNKRIIIVNIFLIILFIILILLISNVIINKGKENKSNINSVAIIEKQV